jgi:hypothetical protein
MALDMVLGRPKSDQGLMCCRLVQNHSTGEPQLIPPQPRNGCVGRFIEFLASFLRKDIFPFLDLIKNIYYSRLHSKDGRERGLIARYFHASNSFFWSLGNGLRAHLLQVPGGTETKGLA